MKVDLDKKALVDLVNGTSPNYDLFDNPLIKLCGTFNGSYGTWSWNKDNLEKCSEEQLYDLYKLCRSSWS